MNYCIIVFMLSLSSFQAIGSTWEVTPAAILSGKYAKELFPDQFKYTQNVEKYKQSLKVRKSTYQKLDSLASLDILEMWPEEEQQKFKGIISLAKNDLSGDVYTHIKELGSEYAFTLNKVTNLNDIYVMERTLTRVNKEIQELEDWAAEVAEVAQYWYEDFINGKLINDFYFYTSILRIDKDIQKVEQTYQNNIGFLILEDEQSAKSLYFIWKARKADIKQFPQREFLFMQLEKRFTITFTE